MEPLLALASDLEQRDARVAAQLARIESEQARVEALRADATRLTELLAWLPQAVSENEYALHEARRRLAEAEADVARLEEHRNAFARQGDEARAELAGLGASLEELSERRGALLVEHSNLVREREAVVREASELLGSVLGDPLASTSVAGLRERLRRALA
jgi:chromosome segregation ATPase